MRLQHLIESQQFSRELLEELFTRADELRENPPKFADSLAGKILISWFYEPSSRTRLSFESGMVHLGGQVIGTDNAGEFSSVAKGESLADSIRTVANYGDIIVLRHPETGSAELAAAVSPKPVINGGDGTGQHPSQALLDVYTIKRELGRVDDVRIAMVGDLARGRTVRSLSYLLTRFSKPHITFVSPPKSQIGSDIKGYLVRHNVPYLEREELNAVLPDVDIVYMTRAQKERKAPDGSQIEAPGDEFSIHEGNLHLVKSHARILHPLPHKGEIRLPITIESDPRIAYFRQEENGLYARMALLHHMLAA